MSEIKPQTPNVRKPPPPSAAAPQKPETLDERLDEALDESFPASDPPAVHSSTTDKGGK